MEVYSGSVGGGAGGLAVQVVILILLGTGEIELADRRSVILGNQNTYQKFNFNLPVLN